jgi:hypothetical protein
MSLKSLKSSLLLVIFALISLWSVLTEVIHKGPFIVADRNRLFNRGYKEQSVSSIRPNKSIRREKVLIPLRESPNPPARKSRRVHERKNCVRVVIFFYKSPPMSFCI